MTLPDETENLRTQLNALLAEREWVYCDDEMPSVKGMYLVTVKLQLKLTSPPPYIDWQFYDPEIGFMGGCKKVIAWMRKRPKPAPEKKQ